MQDVSAVRIIAGIALIFWITFIVFVPLKLWDKIKKTDFHYRELNPTARPFKWGYAFGWSSCFFGALVSIGLLSKILVTNASGVQGDVSDKLAVIYLLAWSAPLTVSGYFVARRQRWAWVFATILSLNPIIWGMNFFYCMRRWSEPDSVVSNAENKKFDMAPPVEKSISEMPKSIGHSVVYQKIIIFITGIFVLVALLFPPHTIHIPNGWKVNVGFMFLFHEGVEAVNLELLLVEIVAIIVAGALIWFFVKR